MILILSIRSDYSTDEVIKWLKFLKKEYVRINEDDEVTIDYLSHDELIFKFEGQTYSLENIGAIWYRRGDFNINTLPFKIKERTNITKGYNKDEASEILVYIHNLFKTKKNLNNRNLYHVNKLDVLRYCKQEGLNSAPFIVTQSKEQLIDFYEKEKSLISKAVGSPYVLLTSKMHYASYTHLMQKEDVDSLPNYFTPTFFQAQIEKKYEIRTFYLEGKFYSMSIFSQKNDQTKVDFRHYDFDNPNITMPFKLPENYEKKMDKMLKHFEVNCASLDTIISNEDDYFMIDINPIGQFGMTSIPCNYNLEKIIAEYLSDER